MDTSLNDLLRRFLAERCYNVPGAKVKAYEVLAAFRTWCGENLIELRGTAAKRDTILDELQRLGYPLGYVRDRAMMLGNLSLYPPARLIKSDTGKLVLSRA